MLKKLICAFFAAVLLLCGAAVYADSDMIIIPGYMGSKLFSDSGLENRVFGDSADIMQLITAESDVFYVKEPVNLQKAAEYGTGGRYKALANALCAKYPKRKVYFFSYDFTKGVNQAAEKLSGFVSSLEEKPVLICDSMGSLVAAKMFSLRGNFNAAEKTICVGAPLGGCVYASLAADTGFADGLGLEDLYPTEEYVKDSGYSFLSKSAFNAKEFMKDSGAYYAAGGGILTASGLIYDENSKISEIVYDNDGDGTIAEKSCRMPDKTAVFNVEHSALISSGEVINWIISVLEGNEKFDNNAEKKDYDVIRVSGPVHVTVKSGGEKISQNGTYTKTSVGEIICTDKIITAAAVRGQNTVILKGTADGTVNVNIKRFDKNNRKIFETDFSDAPVTENGQLQFAPEGDCVSLYIDFDGDGVFEERAQTKKDEKFSFNTSPPVFSQKGGVYKKAFSLRLETPVNGAKIYYTTDGSDPKENGILYNGEIKITNSCTVNAVAVREHYKDSEQISAKYEIRKNNGVFIALMWLVIAAAVLIISVKLKKVLTNNK